jgi:RNA polymerase sigma-70 factor (ECF subfamily)
VDRDDFQTFYHEHYPLVSNLAFKMLGDRADCEDVVQQVFLNISRAIDQFRGESSLKTWVYRITVNACQRWIERRANKRDQAVEDFETLLESAGAGPQFGPDDSALLAEALSLVRDGCYTALAASLPFEQRVVFVFVQMLDWSVEDVANLLEVSVAAVKSRLHRARDSMAAFFEPHCSHLTPSNPCKCLSRLPLCAQIDSELLRRAALRLAQNKFTTRNDQAGPRTLLEIVRQLPAHEGDPAAKSQFFRLLDSELANREP